VITNVGISPAVLRWTVSKTTEIGAGETCSVCSNTWVFTSQIFTPGETVLEKDSRGLFLQIVTDGVLLLSNWMLVNPFAQEVNCILQKQFQTSLWKKAQVPGWLHTQALNSVSVSHNNFIFSFCKKLKKL